MTEFPSVEACGAVRTVLQTVYAAEIAAGWVVADDRLLRAHGKDYAADIGHLAVYQEAERPNPRRRIELVTTVRVQCYLGFEAEPNEEIVRDPNVIGAYAGRLRAALEGDGSNGTGANASWFLRMGDVEYPPDPTGNITRFEALIEHVGENSAALYG